MAAVINEHHHQHGAKPLLPSEGFMQKFRLYETKSRFYMVGRDKSRTIWKILIIDRSENSELSIREDSTIYTEKECSDLLRRIHEGNRVTGGLKFVTTCYGIVGFVKFLGPYYMILVTRRRQIGTICGHDIYAIAKSDIIALSDSCVSGFVNFQKENRYKKLLSMVDLTKDFYFSYSYQVMRSLQKNICCDEKGLVLYENMFVWNEYLTHEIRNMLQNTVWTVALVYGFFKQATLSISGRNLKLTLIARRSRHYAGTRYLKRGVNEKGCVANDVETEQILTEDSREGLHMQMSSVVQIRGSIPLFWSQETSRLNLKPDIILSRRDQTYEATRLHFESLVQRYGNPIIILNLIKTNEKKPRESILRGEFANAIELINKDLPEENRLKFLHWDLHKHSRSKATNVLLLLGKVAAYALTLTGLFYCQAIPEMVSEGHLEHPFLNGDDSTKQPMIQKGVLRTNCIDCLDRTNVAQYAYGLSALGHQLHALGVTTSPKMDLDDPLAEELMGLYERMGDTLAHQYGGSAAHNKIFSERRGHWKAAIQSQEFFRTLQRYYSNAYMDAEKQNSINVFLGHFRPQPDKPDVWELHSDQRHIIGRNGLSNVEKDEKLLIKKSWSDGNILHTTSSTLTMINKGSSGSDFSRESKRGGKMHSESTPDMTSAKSESPTSARDLFTELQSEKNFERENGDASDCSNFVDLDWLSSSGNSCEDELLDRSLLTESPITVLSSENVVSELVLETPTSSTYEYGSSSKVKEQFVSSLDEAHEVEDKVVEEFSDHFKQWVTHGETLCYCH